MAEAQAKQVRQFVQKLEREDRYIVLLYYADGLTPVEIARVLDLPSNRVRNRLQDLRSQLNLITQPSSKTGKKAIDTTGMGGTQPVAYA